MFEQTYMSVMNDKIKLIKSETKKIAESQKKISDTLCGALCEGGE